MEWIDSANGMDYGNIFLDHCGALMYYIAVLELGDNRVEHLGPGEWRMQIRPMNGQQAQTDTCNCGVFTLMNCLFQAYHPKLPLTFLNSGTIDNYRPKIIKDLVMDALELVDANTFTNKVTIILEQFDPIDEEEVVILDPIIPTYPTEHHASPLAGPGPTALPVTSTLTTQQPAATVPEHPPKPTRKPAPSKPAAAKATGAQDSETQPLFECKTQSEAEEYIKKTLGIRDNVERTLTLAKWRKNRQKSQDSAPEIKLYGPKPTGATMERETEGDLEAKGPGKDEEQHSEPVGTRETGDTSAKKDRVNEGDLEAKDPCNEEEQLSEPIGVWDIGVMSATNESENVRKSEAKGPCNDEEQLIVPSDGIMSATKESENTRELEGKSLDNEEKDQTVDNRAAIDRANTVHTQKEHDNITSMRTQKYAIKTKTKNTKNTKAHLEVSNKTTQKGLDDGETETKDSPYTGRITRSMNGASRTDAWKRSRPSVGSGNGGRMLRSQVPKAGVERKGIT